MSITLIDALETHLQAGGLLAGYTVRKNRWTDLDEESGAEFIVIRNGGSSGQSSRIMQQRNLRLLVVASASAVVASQNRAEAIVDYLRQPSTPANVVRFSVRSDVTGPLYMTDGRAILEIPVVVYTSEALQSG